MRNSKAVSILILAAMVAVPGCAVLTVDVDVYKGPLSNHKEVQTEQVAAIALAARPLLARLRYSLERYHPDNIVLNDNQLPDCVIKLKSSGQFEECIKFASHHAELVNQLLALYSTNNEQFNLAEVDATQSEASTPEMHRQTLDALGPKLAKPTPTSELFAARRGPRVGMEALVYRHELARLGKKDDEIKRTREALHNSLIHFSQRVLYLANHETLFAERDGLYPGAWKRARILVLGGPIGDDAYVKVMQAIGNSVLSQLDAIKQEAEHDDRLTGSGSRELIAANQFESMAAPQALEHLLGTIRINANVPDVSVSAVLALEKGASDAKLQADQSLQNVLPGANMDATLQAQDARLKATEEARAVSKSMDDAKQVQAFMESSDDVKSRVNALYGDAAELSLKDLISKFQEAAARAAGVPKAPAGWRATQQMMESILKSPPQGVNMDDKVKPQDGHSNILRVLKSRVEGLVAQEAKYSAVVTAAAAAIQADIKLVDLRKSLKQARAYAHIKDVRDKALELAVTKPSYESVITSLRLILDNKRQSAIDSSELEQAEQYKESIELLAGITPPPTLLSGMTEKTSAKDVIENMITLLRYEHVNALKSNARDSIVVQRLEAAIHAAELQRSGMIHIRPASAYLRTSFAVSTLQPDAKIGWKNTLGQHAQRQITLGLLEESNRNQRALVEIDKQYWQNVNTIRVAGMGNTNYVLAKDDVGNWYIKNYSADPKPVIDSAKNLAMFAYGSSLGPQAVAQIAKQSRVEQAIRVGQTNGDTQAEINERVKQIEAEPTTTAELQFQTVNNRLVKKTMEQYQQLREAADGLGERLKGGWAGEANLADIKTQLDAIATTSQANLRKAAPTPARSPAAEPVDSALADDEILKLFRASRGLHLEVSAKVNELIPIAGEDEAKKTAQAKRDAAIKVLNSIIKEGILSVHTARTEALKQYQIEVSLIHESQVESASKASKGN